MSTTQISNVRGGVTIEIQKIWEKFPNGGRGVEKTNKQVGPTPESNSILKCFLTCQLLLKPTEVELGLQVGVEFDKSQKLEAVDDVAVEVRR